MQQHTPGIFSPFVWGLGVATLAISSPAFAIDADNFNNQTIQFGQNTTVEFEFVESHGAYQSTFGVVNLATGEKTALIREVKSDDGDFTGASRQNDFIGTPGNTVPQAFSEFNFAANTPYSLYLESRYQGKDAGTVFSSNPINKGQNKQAQMNGDFASLADGKGILASFDDTGSVLVQSNKADTDFNDFVVAIGGYKPCKNGDSGPVPTDMVLPAIQPRPTAGEAPAIIVPPAAAPIVIPQTW
jgi:hypothetical protein